MVTYSPYAKRPEGFLEKPCLADQTLRQAQDNAFGTVRNITYLITSQTLVSQNPL